MVLREPNDEVRRLRDEVRKELDVAEPEAACSAESARSRRVVRIRVAVSTPVTSAAFAT
jgi:hypothetical protein